VWSPILFANPISIAIPSTIGGGNVVLLLLLLCVLIDCVSALVHCLLRSMDLRAARQAALNARKKRAQAQALAVLDLLIQHHPEKPGNAIGRFADRMGRKRRP
jgi:Na+-transporting methylmalonyl-CoA/oxaloacetate decarboxylase gamma subunit